MGSLAVLMATEPAGRFLMISTVVTAALVVAGAGASTLWFLSALRGLGLTLRFAAPSPARHEAAAGDGSLRPEVQVKAADPSRR
jgi:hypothetical protein